MKNIFAVLLLAITASTAAAEEPKKPADFSGAATMCNGTYALCIKAPCDKNAQANGYAPCRCIIETGWNMGPNSCDDRLQSLTSTYSNLFNLGSATVSCPKSTEWAWCYGAKCEADPADPTKAICKCPTSSIKPTVVLVSAALCPAEPAETCKVLWSGATPEASKFANDYYYWWMTTNGHQSNLPATACPVPPSN